MLNLREKQFTFTRNVAKLIFFAEEKGFEVRMREVLRTQEQQDFYVRQGYTKTHSSRHLSGLAVDLELFKEGKYTKDFQDYEILGNYWAKLSKWNVWGGIWDKHPELNHFEME